MMNDSHSISRAMMAVFASLMIAATMVAQTAPQISSATVSGLPARNIGSAMMSGRIAAVAGVNQDGRITLFVGSASGGVWKSINGGTTFKPVFDQQDVQSIGAVAIDPSNPKNVWVGTGESWMRNSVSVGDGIYKSTDGGEDWENVGLKGSEHISKILIDPKDSNRVLACATGHAFNDSDTGGVYGTADGGKTWTRLLAGANGSTGCGMLSASAKNPSTIYASMWDFRRQGWTFRSGGPGSGIYRSDDGGLHWAEMTDANAKGLPAKPWGRTAIAVAPSKPQVVFAMIECKDSALFRSDDGGKTWKKLDASQYMIWRPFYFANLIVDPVNENKLFKPDLQLLLSVNGGTSFSSVANAHGDFHDVWIDPTNPNLIYAGDDGGLWNSQDGGTRWAHQLNLPVSQFYHVSIDNSDPYHVYGGLQDNSSWVGDSSYPGGVANAQWENMFGGDGFWMFEDPADPDYIYAEAQGGEIGRVNRHSLEMRSIKPFPNYGQPKLRFNWNTPIHMSPNEKGTIYIGAQYLFRSRDHGQSWEQISPDLTTNDPEKQKQEESGGITVDNSSAEMHTSIYSISESPRNGQIIWVGTDDGNLQVTRDGAKTWTNVVGNAKGLAANSWVSTVAAGRFDDGVAYATFDRHTYGDMTPYAYKTSDYGKTWTSLNLAENGVRGYAHVITEDTKNANVLFVGTEFGLWITVDGGQHWAQYRGGDFPAVAVRDIVVQPRTSDLVLATHGRGIWIIDNISPLRQLTPDLMAKDAVVLEGPPSIQYFNANGGWAQGDAAFVGPSRPNDAMITYYQKARHMFGDLKIEVFDPSGTELTEFTPKSKHKGLNRVPWSMRLPPPIIPPGAQVLFQASEGPRVLPGTYPVKLVKGDQAYNGQVTLVLDPRAKYNLDDRKAEYDLTLKLYKMLGHMSYEVAAILAVRDDATDRASKLPKSNPLNARLETLSTKADALRSKIVATKEGGAITGEERIREHVGELYGDVTQYEGRPTTYQVARADSLDHELADVVADFNKLTADLPAINSSLQKAKLTPITVPNESEWIKEHSNSGEASVKASAMMERD
ncbi:MAG: glycosyl hydrolase [Candidatus Korobacteraceae bacterium]